ncbi:hypothetical protein J2046_004165 [Rhizobium petrolearium]|uniref:hypothetical protein n=1 Tax=Neorhizobium petrolearium TaxID=515361 RepID=UPI001AE26396|nr:hypothetical protein [Neorhizobium petrolearium]MBP1845891.1 hypothetical protein [Neorhizobium petrolearium]
MDAFLQLALIEKAKRVFSHDERVMLSFPLLEPLSFTEAELSALASPQTPADYTMAANFARSANFLPTDMVASATERMLWDVFADVLARADVGSADSQDDHAAAASELLSDLTPDGTRVESEALRRYRQYRDAWLVAGENYASHKLTGELSEDPAVKRRWLAFEEPTLRAAQDEAMTAWEMLGNRVEIELAIQALRTAALQNPRLTWAEWSDDFNPDTDMLTDTTGAQYAPTGLSPHDFASKDDWLSFELSAGEMAALVADAPEQFRTVLGDSTGSRYEYMQFDYRSVAINRPWFRPEVLTSQIWRTSDPELILSDGAVPPSGACPAYATAIVFIRNVKVVERNTVSTGGGSSSGGRPYGGSGPHMDPGDTGFTPLVAAGLRFTLDPQTFTKRRDLRAGSPLASSAIQGAELSRPAPSIELDARHTRAFQRLRRNSFAVSPQNINTTTASNFSMVRARRPRWGAEVGAGHHFDREGSGTSPQPPVSPIRPDQLSILAFICKRLPKAPDPALTLLWR